MPPSPPSPEVSVGLAIFGSLVTEMAAPDLPEGVSPDNQDVVYYPGGVQSRPALQRIYNFLPAGATITYLKTFIQPNGLPLNLILDSFGNLWSEDVFNSPGVGVKIGFVTPGCYCSSTTAFGREYLAFHDGKNGVDIPRQFDGTYFDRVSQDGPGAPPMVEDETLSYSLTLLKEEPVNASQILQISEVGNLVTVVYTFLTTQWPIPRVGDMVQIANVVTAGYNGTFQVTASSVSGSQVTIQYIASVLNLPPDGTGNVTSPYIFAQLLTKPQLVVGQNALIAGTSGTPNYNGVWTVIEGPYLDPDGIHWDMYLAGMTFGIGDELNTGTISPAGQITPGSHGCVVMFLTRQGSLTQASTPFLWTAGGDKRAIVTNLPIGPPNVVARYLAFTGAGGANYFAIEATVVTPATASTPAVTVMATIVPDNTSTTAIFDFSDNALFDATAIDIPGANQFALSVLGPSIGFLSYAERLVSWGENNRILNLINMGFNGGYLQGSPYPLGWTAFPYPLDGGLTNLPAPSGAGFGMAWLITGIAGQGSNPVGLLTQSAYQDYYNISILAPNTQYTFKCWMEMIVNTGSSGGDFYCDLYSPTQGQLAVAAIPILATAPPNQPGGFVAVDFSAKTPAVIPADTVLRIYAIGLQPGVLIYVNEMEIIPTQDPYTNQLAVSYVANPEAFDSETGLIADQDPTGIQVAFDRYDTLHFLSNQSLYRTNDNALGEPDSWAVVEISGRCGAAGPRACDIGENIAFWVSTPSVAPPTARGLYVYFGGQVYKASQEIQPDFDAVNPAAESSIWVVNDMISRRLLIGLPIGGATAPNLIYPLDYRELDIASDIATHPPIHISFTGKMICSDLCRKWTRWNVAANCGAMYRLANGVVQFTVGGGNGQAPGQSPGFANAYWFNPAKSTDDDYGTIVPYYVPYFFVNHEAEMALQVGLQRKLFKRYSAFISGVGAMLLTPYADSLANPYPSPPQVPLSVTALTDIGDGLNVSAERMTCKIQSVPLPGQTDNAFNLQKFTLTMKKEPVSPIRFGAV